MSVPDSEQLIKIAVILETTVSELLGTKVENEEKPDQLAKELSRINTQLAIRNHRTRRVLKIIAAALLVFAALIFAIMALNYAPNQRIIAGNAQFTGIAAGQGVGFTTGLLLLREGLGMRETPIRPHSWHCRMQSDYQYDGNRKRPPVWRRHRGSLRPRGRNLGGVEGMTGAAVRGATQPSIQGGYEYITGRGACAWPRASPSSLRRDGSSR